MGHPAEHQTNTARRLLVVGCATGGRDAFIAEAGKQIPLGRMSGPEEVARHVRFLLSAEASFLTGQAFAADGGETLL